MTSTTFISIVLTLVMPGFCNAWLGSQTPEAEDSTNETLSLPPMPVVRPSLIEGFDDHASYRQSITERLADLQNRVNEADGVESRVKLLLAQANHILAFELEPACTSKLLQLQDQPLRNDPPEQFRAAFDRAERVMNQVKDALESMENAQKDSDDELRNTRKSLNILQAFARAQRAYLLEDADDPQREARRAASGLSALVENDDPKIASAATFWQACIRSRESDPSVVLSRLDYALAKISKSTLPYSFFARLLRCRILTDQGGYPLTLSLLLQLEEHSREWFFDAAMFDHAYRTLSLMRIQTLRKWYEKLPEKTHADERRWCVEQIQHLMESRFDGDHKLIMRLWPAIPIVAPIPE